MTRDGIVQLEQNYKISIGNETILRPVGRPWVRYVARSIDHNIYLFTSILTVLASIMLFSTGLWILCAIAMILVLPIIEPVLLSTLGTTPGKWLLRTKIVKESGERLDFMTALKRTWLLYIKGEGLFLPLISLITSISSHTDVTLHGITTWDKKYKLTVIHQKIGIIRAIVAIFLFVMFEFVTFGIFLFINYVATI